MDPDGKRLEQMIVEDLNVAILERETPSRRRRRAAQAEIIDELDELISDLDD